MKVKLLKIQELKFCEEIYPRIKPDWLTTYQYRKAMEAGSKFPPILAGKIANEEGYYIIDGVHRVEAYKQLKEEYIEAIVKEYNSFEEAFVEAVKLNISHGRPLSVQERVRIIDKLEEMNFSKEEISEIVKVPISEIESLKSRCIEVEGMKEYLKAPLVKISDKTFRKIIKHAHPEEIEMAQKLLAVRHQLKLIQQLMDLIKTGTIDLENPQVRSALLELRDMLNKLEVRI